MKIVAKNRPLHFFLRALAVSVLLCGIACSSGGGTSGTGGEVFTTNDSVRRFTGVVNSSTENQPIANVVVTVGESGVTTTTDEFGRFDFESAADEMATLVFSSDQFEVTVLVDGLQQGVAGADVTVLIDESASSVISSEVLIIDGNIPADDDAGTSPGDSPDDSVSSDDPLPPIVCTLEYAPVCGVDLMTYGNLCAAQAVNVEVAYNGECQGAGGNVACPEIYAPVCGVNGQTYSSACVAVSQGVAVATQGECSRSR